MKRAISFVLLIAMNVVSLCQNLVVNPGFEEWSKITRPAGWSHVENCLKDSVSVISGSYSCMHIGGASTTSDLGQTISVIPGKKYNLSLFNKTIITSTGKGSRIWCYWKDAENKSIYDTTTDDILRPSQYFKNDTWQEFSISVVAPPEATAFYLEVRTNTNSMAWWDDITFEEMITTSYDDRHESHLNIYPNPVKDYLIIDNAHNLKHIDIIKLTGAKIWQSDFSGEQTIRITVSGFPDGIYILRIITLNKMITRKFLKN